MFARAIGSRIRTAAPLLALAALLVPAARGIAVPVQWSTEAGGNGHYYEFIRLPATTSYAQATAQAHTLAVPEDRMLGHLVTLSSAEEQAFVQSQVLPTFGVNKNQVWIGGVQQAETANPGSPIYTTGDVGWSWVSRPYVAPEAWDYENWLSENEPNNDGGSIDERFLTMWVHYYKNGQDLRGTWNDEKLVAPSTAQIIGMIVEWSVPEPGAGALALLGLGAAAALRRR